MHQRLLRLHIRRSLQHTLLLRQHTRLDNSVLLQRLQQRLPRKPQRALRRKQDSITQRKGRASSIQQHSPLPVREHWRLPRLRDPSIPDIRLRNGYHQCTSSDTRRPLNHIHRHLHQVRRRLHNTRLHDDHPALRLCCQRSVHHLHASHRDHIVRFQR